MVVHALDDSEPGHSPVPISRHPLPDQQLERSIIGVSYNFMVTPTLHGNDVAEEA
jgi:hypothetical protein